jgi:hypothetical protein
MLRIDRQLVLRKLAIAFPIAAEREQALKSLDRYGTSENEPSKEGVQLAVIKLSEGQLWRLRELVRQARHDFRDVLYVAQAPEKFRHLKENPPPLWGEHPQRKPLSRQKEDAMAKRDIQQWLKWLSTKIKRQ